MLVNSGAGQLVAMQISAHKTASVFQRYQITTEADVLANMPRVERHEIGVRLGGILPSRSSSNE
jgi:hypothetical protein